MKTFLNREDYEIYRVNIPVRLLFGKGNKSYLLEMLEKLHPCFSESYVYDNKLCLSGKGFVSELTVIDRNMLGEYRFKFPGAVLMNENKKKVFGKRNSGIFLLSVLTVVVISTGFSVKQKLNKRALPLMEPVLSETIPPSFVKGPGLFQKTLDEVFEAYGEIKKIQWHCDGVSESLDLSIEGIWPTDLKTLWNESECQAKTALSQVLNSGGKPAFSISRKTELKGKVRNDAPVDRRGFHEELRKRIETQKGKVLVESYNPVKVEFEMTPGEKTSLLLKQLSECAEASGFIPSGLIFENRKSVLFMGLEFTDSFQDPFQKNILQYLSEKQFFKNEEIPVTEKTVKQKPETVAVEKQKKSNGSEKTVGKISHENNRTRIYIKNEKGKMEEKEIEVR